MKICKDCKHYVKGPSKVDVCNRKNVIDKSTVNALSSTCELERSYGALKARIFDRCGLEGRFYEPNE